MERKKVVDWSHSLIKEEIKALSLGRSFRIRNNIDDITKFSIAETERWIDSHPHLEQHLKEDTRKLIFSKLWELKGNFKDNLSEDERKGLSRIKNRRNTRILQADKGGALVCVEDAEYKKAKNLVLEDKTTFRYTKFNSLLGAKSTRTKWLNKFNLTADIPIYESSPSLVLFPKVHKEDKAWRPVISSKFSPLRVVEKFLTPLLKKIVRPNILNSYDVIDYLNGLELERDEVYLFGALDVVSMYPSLSRIKLKTYLDDLLLNNNDLTVLEKEMVNTGVNLCLKQDFLMDNDKFYKIIKGLGIGSTISPALGELYLSSWEKNHIFDMNIRNSHLVAWIRYIDDVLLIWKATEEELRSYVELLNTHDCTLQFTFDVNKTIQFLDLNISLDSSNKFLFTWFHKDCWVGSITHNRSDTSLLVKKNILYSFYKRIIRLNNHNINKSDLTKVRKVLLDRGYHYDLINKIYKDVLRAFKNKTLFVNRNREKINLKETFCIDYNVSVNSEDWSFLKIPPIILRKGGIPILDYIRKRSTPFRCKMNELNKFENLVYSIPCGSSPDRIYIGETKRLLHTRIKEHMRAVTNMDYQANAIAWHVNISTHLPDWSDIKILHKESDTIRRKILEAIEIKKRILNDKKIINISNGFELSEIWTAII